MKRLELAMAIGLICSILLTSFTAFARECDDIRHEVVRLHILANSDSDEDQQLKLQVRDAILAGTEDLFTASRTKEEAEALAAGRLEEIEALAQAELRRRGSDYQVTARIVNRFFDTRIYDGFTMPAGRYDAVQVEIGDGVGKNWWCVMFPPMCLPAAQGHEDTELEEQIKSLGEQPIYKPAFAVVELLESIQERLGSSGEETEEVEHE